MAIVLTSTVVFLAVALSADSSADTEVYFEDGDFFYVSIDDTTAALLNYFGDGPIVDIPPVATDDAPDTPKSYSVVEILGTFGEGITEINIPSSISEINMYAFSSAIDLESISVDPSSTHYESDSFGVLYTAGLHKLIQYPIGKTDLTYSIENVTSEICSNAFANSSLTSVTMPANLLKIGNSAFYQCENLTSISFPANLSIIEWDAFYGCSSLAEVVFPDELDMIGSFAFFGTAVTGITIPYGIEYIGDNAFASCVELKEFTSESYKYDSTDGVLYESTDDYNKGKTLICYPAGKTDTEFVVPGNTNISYGAFWGCTNLKGVSFPSGYNTIPEGAFYECTSLETVDLTNITFIGSYAFDNCTNLTTINNYGDVLFIESLAFYKCALPEVHISSKVISVGNWAFSNCESLYKVIIDDSCKATFGAYVFEDDVNLKKITINSKDVIFEEDSLVISDYEGSPAYVDVYVPSGYDIPPEASNEYTILNIIREGERPYPWENWIGVFFCVLVILGILYAMREV